MSEINTYEGNFEFLSQPGWVPLGKPNHDGELWNIHRTSVGAPKVRVTADGEVERKANYIMSWDGGDLSGRDAELLKKYRPKLYDRVIQSLVLSDEFTVKTPVEQKQRGRLFTSSLGGKYYVKHDLGLLEGACWLLAKRAGPNKGNWDMFKLVADRPVPNKAGYYLEWNGTRLAKSRDAKLLIDHRPELYERVVSALSGGKQQEQEDLWGEFIDNTGGN